MKEFEDMRQTHRVVVEFTGDDAMTAKIVETDCDGLKLSAIESAALCWASCMNAAKALHLSNDDAKQFGVEINHAMTKALTKYALTSMMEEILQDD